MKLDSKGILTYYDLDKPNAVKGTVNLKHQSLAVRFMYVQKQPQQGDRLLPN